MITDLTPKLLLARQRAENWSKANVHRLADLLIEANPGSRLWWDWEAGEGWGMIVLAKDGIAYICSARPLLTMSDDCRRPSGLTAEFEHLVVIETPDFAAPIFSIDLDKWPIFSDIEWDPEGIDASALSIDDLVCASI